MIKIFVVDFFLRKKNSFFIDYKNKTSREIIKMVRYKILVLKFDFESIYKGPLKNIQINISQIVSVHHSLLYTFYLTVAMATHIIHSKRQKR